MIELLTVHNILMLALLFLIVGGVIVWLLIWYRLMKKKIDSGS